MKQRLPIAWGSLLALLLLSLVPLGHPTAGGAERAFGQTNREGAPLSPTPAAFRFLDLPAESLRPNHLSGPGLLTNVPRFSLRLVVVSNDTAEAGAPVRPAPVAYPYFPTGPPIRS